MSKSHESLPFVEKYRPSHLNDVVLSPINRLFFNRILETHSFPHLLLYGPPGTGKTSTILNLIREYKERHQLGKGSVIHLNASDERGIDIIRNHIVPFVRSTPMFESPYKFVVLDEVDYMTKNAQQALKYLIQMSSNNVRFCLICNYSSKIDHALQNELLCVRFNQQPREEILRFLRTIVDKEGMQVDDTMLAAILDLYSYDVRSMINHLQLHIGHHEECHRMLSQDDMNDLQDCWDDAAAWDRALLRISSVYNIEPRDILCRFFDAAIRRKMKEADADVQQGIWLQKWRQRYDMLKIR